ncbi:MAG: 3-oxoacyl-[acyl-carrier protein] reductase [Verrucomicrobiota bacterium]|jgi:3-oxoacyl-[acyl-carrier protein] reductase|nr:3-oxoacyl-[acyl-carrier protein] reductase [Verrucomicrobiota bacterium]MDK2963883.1 3-oxoacyl-[acyl-carrier protein] reductase [Verrucomicrobiota bacterium]
MKTVVVTGASRGIGAAIAQKLSERGYFLFLTARDDQKLNEVKAACEKSGSVVKTVVADVTNPQDIACLFDSVDRVDLLVNNAGIGIFEPLETIPLENWRRIQQVNVEGALFCMQAAFKKMKKQGGGRIINISSVVGVKGYPDQAAYGASKHALLGLTKTAIEEGRQFNIRVHAVCPGGVATDMVRQARPDLTDFSEMIQPEEVASAVAYLDSLPPTITVDVIHLRRAASAQTWG